MMIYTPIVSVPDKDLHLEMSICRLEDRLTDQEAALLRDDLPIQWSETLELPGNKE